MRRIISIFLAAGLFSGCTHLASVSTTSIPRERGGKVSAERSKFIFLAFNFSNEYVEDMAEDLAEKCPDGKIEGLLTKHESIVYFPLLFHSVRVSAEGYCSASAGAGGKKGT
jgi:hypothetical protein